MPTLLDCAPVDFACGFKHIYNRMSKVQASELKARLIEEYGEYNYYRYYRGEFLTPPAVQETIQRIAKELGITEPIQFLAKERMPCWGDYKIKRKG